MQIDCIMSAVLNVNNIHESIRSPSLYSVVRSEKEGGGTYDLKSVTAREGNTRFD